MSLKGTGYSTDCEYSIYEELICKSSYDENIVYDTSKRHDFSKF